MATREIPKIKVTPRKTIGSKDAARIRKTGAIPAVIYGHGQDPAHVALDRKEITDLLHRNAHVLEATVDSKAEPVLIKEVQWNHLGSQIVHVDLARVDLNERVKVDVRIELTGEAPGLKEAGAILEHPVDAIEIECLVTQIPESIKVDVGGLNVGDTFLVRDLKLPAGVTTTADPNMTIASISVVSETAAEPTVPVEGAAAEPEVIGKKAEEGEAAEGEAAAPGAKPAAGAAAPAAGAKKAEAAPKK